MDAAELTEAVLAQALAAGIDACGVCRAEPYLRAERAIGERSAAGLFADMGFTIRRPDRSCHPELALRNARSVIAVAQSYARPEPEKPNDAPRGRMPRYARRDEYAVLRDRLRSLGAWLREEVPGCRFAVHVDSNGHVDREAAARAGIAVFGKNTLAITRRHGSWVVLGALITDAELAPTHTPAEQPAWDACGECRACIDACPTDAIVADGVLDARSCLSYLSQSRLEQLPHAEAFEDRVYGCDICQDVCPWNRGAERRAGQLAPDPVDEVYPLLGGWLSADPEQLVERYRRLYVPDLDGRHLQRNARIALANVSAETQLG
ncbi:MAG: epoxyqueuosine reductase [Gaiellales bacterium]|nr:epoxyqueuosine reductase [Gaiellales bacterium]MDX6549424.1 epoxyqueuosine reductase [Gaiellales bacterium]